MYISMRLIKIRSNVLQRKLLKFKPSSFQKKMGVKDLELLQRANISIFFNTFFIKLVPRV